MSWMHPSTAPFINPNGMRAYMKDPHGVMKAVCFFFSLWSGWGIIKTLSQKVGKLKIENKNLSRQNAQVNNQGYNQQYRRPPLQLLLRETKEHLDQIPSPLYLEDNLDEKSSDTQEMQVNIYVGFVEEEHENMAHHEAIYHKEVAAEEEYMDYCCTQFAEFMQT